MILVYYGIYEHELQKESYLDLLPIDKRFKTALARFRTSSYNVNIGQGRYEGTV